MLLNPSFYPSHFFQDQGSERPDDTATLLAKTELFLTEEAGILEAEGLEKTFKFTQEQLKPNLSISAAAKSFDLKLDKFGPYAVDYTAMEAGRKEALASIDWKAGKLNCELHLKETVRDVKFLHNETMFAVAQKKYVYIYDNVGREILCLKQHREVSNLDLGMLRYLDVSTGKMISGSHHFRKGQLSRAEHSRCGDSLWPRMCIDQFSQRGILAVGFTGNISLWKDVCKTKQISPYMNHKAAPHQIHDLQFCPYEDISLGSGHSGGFSSLVVPGAGEPNFDSLEVNLYETVKQRREREVHSLLNKEEEKATTGAKIELRNRARGKSSSASRFHRKKGLQDLERKKERAQMLAARQATNTQTTVQLQPPRASAIQPNSALDRFRKKAKSE
ncbi:putative U3 small nucleolar RNA-associated protein 7 [Massospora cicadina]|nr:putative U3 small nucleolar RNA-associated protein 7 [Massospora cicadina]